MMWRQALSLCMLLVVTTNASGKKLVLDADDPTHWDEVSIGDMFSTEVVADMKRVVRVPESYYWFKSGSRNRVGWRKDLKQIRRKSSPKIRYGYFLSKTSSSFVYDSEQRTFGVSIDGEYVSLDEYLDTRDSAEIVFTKAVIDDHDVLIAEGILDGEPLHMVLIAENIGRSALMIRFVCDEGACREPSPLAWRVFRQNLLVE